MTFLAINFQMFCLFFFILFKYIQKMKLNFFKNSKLRNENLSLVLAFVNYEQTQCVKNILAWFVTNYRNLNPQQKRESSLKKLNNS